MVSAERNVDCRADEETEVDVIPAGVKGLGVRVEERRRLSTELDTLSVSNMAFVPAKLLLEAKESVDWLPSTRDPNLPKCEK